MTDTSPAVLRRLANGAEYMADNAHFVSAYAWRPIMRQVQETLRALADQMDAPHATDAEREELAKWHEYRANLACNLIESFRIAGKDAALIREYEANVRFHLEAAALLRAPAVMVDAWQPEETAPHNTWLLTRREGEDGKNICALHADPDGNKEWVTWAGRTESTHHSFAPPTHWCAVGTVSEIIKLLGVK